MQHKVHVALALAFTGAVIGLGVVYQRPIVGSSTLSSPAIVRSGKNSGAERWISSERLAPSYTLWGRSVWQPGKFNVGFEISPDVTERTWSDTNDVSGSPVANPPVYVEHSESAVSRKATRDIAAEEPSNSVKLPQKPRPRGNGAKVSHAAAQFLQFGLPTLAPFAHTRFCLKYANDCRVRKIQFRGGAIDLTVQRHAELVRINTTVNQAIKPMRMNESVADEKWLISPRSGDCNDYAVTKRHELLALGWPARSLLLAEVITNWGEHHLVLVIRTRQGDLVADSLTGALRPWFRAGYQWVRIESPINPKFWSTIKPPLPEVIAMVNRASEL